MGVGEGALRAVLTHCGKGARRAARMGRAGRELVSGLLSLPACSAASRPWPSAAPTVRARCARSQPGPGLRLAGAGFEAKKRYDLTAGHLLNRQRCIAPHSGLAFCQSFNQMQDDFIARQIVALDQRESTRSAQHIGRVHRAPPRRFHLDISQAA